MPCSTLYTGRSACKHLYSHSPTAYAGVKPLTSSAPLRFIPRILVVTCVQEGRRGLPIPSAVLPSRVISSLRPHRRHPAAI